MPTEAEVHAKADALMAQYKIDNPNIDWTQNETYAVIDNETGEITKVSSMSKHVHDQMMGKLRA